MRLASWFLALVASACATVVLPPQIASRAAGKEAAIAAYGRVLEKFVDDRGRVDFPALARDRADLDIYVRFIADTPLESFAAGDERLAHMINSYNALSMFNVIDSGIPRTHAGLNKLRFFALREFVVGGRELSLYAYENDVIRKAGDARIHFALNCSALSCPVLPRTPFASRDLQQALDREARRFFASRANLRIDRSARTVQVNEILRFYRDDFTAGGDSLVGFVNKYSPQRVPEDFAVRFIPYDWTIANSHADTATASS